MVIQGARGMTIHASSYSSTFFCNVRLLGIKDGFLQGRGKEYLPDSREEERTSSKTAKIERVSSVRRTANKTAGKKGIK